MYERYIKRVLDILISAVSLSVLSPLLLLVAIAIKLPIVRLVVIPIILNSPIHPHQGRQQEYVQKIIEQQHQNDPSPDSYHTGHDASVKAILQVEIIVCQGLLGNFRQRLQISIQLLVHHLQTVEIPRSQLSMIQGPKLIQLIGYLHIGCISIANRICSKVLVAGSHVQHHPLQLMQKLISLLTFGQVAQIAVANRLKNLGVVVIQKVVQQAG